MKKTLPVRQIGKCVRRSDDAGYMAYQDGGTIICLPLDWLHDETWSGTGLEWRDRFKLCIKEQ